MSEMVRRAAIAFDRLSGDAEGAPHSGTMEGMRAALIAALDPEDEALWRIVGERIELAISVGDMAGDRLVEMLGSAAIQAMHDHVNPRAQGGSVE